MTSRKKSSRHCPTVLEARGKFAAGPPWFLTGPASAEDLTSSDPRIPGLVTHAKSMGTNATACGLATTTWTKLWEIPFEAAPLARRCPLCSARVARAGGHAVSVGGSASRDGAY
jgi:hypothetical protein